MTYPEEEVSAKGPPVSRLRISLLKCESLLGLLLQSKLLHLALLVHQQLAGSSGRMLPVEYSVITT